LFKKWIEQHFKLFGVLLLVLAALNGWVAYSIVLAHPIMAMANAVTALVIVLDVFRFWRAGGQD
jgi:hypothetical protein